MALSIDLNDVDNPEKVGTGGLPKPGKCHATLVNFEEFGATASGDHIATWEILAHDDPDQVGKHFKDFLGDPANSNNDKGRKYAIERILHYCYTLGVTTPDAMVQAKKAGQQPDLDISQGIGGQALVRLVNEEYKGKTNLRVGNAGFDIYPLDHKNANDFPRNQAWAKKAKPQPGAEWKQQDTESANDEADALFGG